MSDRASTRLEEIVQQLLIELGEDSNREGLKHTPERVAESFRFLTRGMDVDPRAVFAGATYREPETDQMIVVRNIEFYSLCEHHLLPFFGRCHIGYVPDRRIVGLSRLATVVETIAARLQLQERLARQIAEAVDENLAPKGVGVVVEASHLCMLMRRADKSAASVANCVTMGSFCEPSVRAEFMTLVAGDDAAKLG